MGKGWVKIHRELEEHYLWQDKPFAKGQAWIDLILNANHKDKKFVSGNELIEVKRGSIVTSIRKLSERWGWSKTKVSAFLKLLKTDHMIDFYSDTKKTVLTIVNYGLYQNKDDAEKTKKRRKDDTEKTPKSTNNKEKNFNKENKYTSKKYDLEQGYN